MAKIDFIDSYKCYTILCSCCEMSSECDSDEVANKQDAWKKFQERGWTKTNKGYILCNHCSMERQR